jgi:hypothetical protein
MIWPFRKRQAPPPAKSSERWPLGLELFRWTPEEPFTLEDACKGVQVFGLTGSGKSSGSGKLIALSYLRSGFGGVVFCAKNSESQTWKEYCELAGRSDDLVIFSPTAPWRFNFLDWERARPGVGAGLTENILQLFMTVAEVASRGSSGGQGRNDEGYWLRSLQQLLRNVIDLLVIGTGKVSIPDLYKVVVSAPTSFEQTNAEAWQKKSFCWQCLQKGDAVGKTGYQAHDFQLVAVYMLLEYPGLSEKTRSVIVSTFTSMIDVLNRGVLRELFSTTTNLTPEDALNGKIIVVDLPVKEFAEVGQFAAVLWKYLFQRSIERRDVRANPRPCFLFADEAQLFTTSFDAMFQTTARSARCSTVNLTQNIHNYYAAYGGESGQAAAKSLLGNLTTQVVHALADTDTATYVAELIGKSRQWFMNNSSTNTGYSLAEDLYGPSRQQASSGFSEQLHYTVDPAELFRMRTGGPQSNFLVDGLIWRGGRPFASTGTSCLWTTFHQLGG